VAREERIVSPSSRRPFPDHRLDLSISFDLRTPHPSRCVTMKPRRNWRYEVE